jgi:hypothetical protein
LQNTGAGGGGGFGWGPPSTLGGGGGSGIVIIAYHSFIIFTNKDLWHTLLNSTRTTSSHKLS